MKTFLKADYQSEFLHHLNGGSIAVFLYFNFCHWKEETCLILLQCCFFFFFIFLILRILFISLCLFARLANEASAARAPLAEQPSR